MGETHDSETQDYGGPRTHRKRWTTIVLEERDDGQWLATQRGVPVAGDGETAAEAATEYCRKISEGGDE